MMRRLRQANHWRQAVKAYEQSRYNDAVAMLRASQAIAPLTLSDHVLLANSLAGEGQLEAAASEYAACMKRSAEGTGKASTFAFVFSAYMRGTVTEDTEAVAHFGKQLGALERPSSFDAFVNRDWRP